MNIYTSISIHTVYISSCSIYIYIDVECIFIPYHVEVPLSYCMLHVCKGNRIIMLVMMQSSTSQGLSLAAHDLQSA